MRALLAARVALGPFALNLDSFTPPRGHEQGVSNMLIFRRIIALATRALGDIVGAFVQVGVAAEPAAPQKLPFEEAVGPAGGDLCIQPDPGRKCP